MSLTYAILGSGRQGVASAHDLAVHGHAARIFMADRDPGVARAAAGQVDDLAGRAVAEPVAVDGSDVDDLKRLLEPCDAALSALPYGLNPGAAAAAIAARCHFADLGGNTEVSGRVLAQDAAAREAGVTLVPDCGLAPGLSATLTAWLMEAMEEPRAIHLRCGGLPQQPSGPLDYQLVFSPGGLVNEYLGFAEVLRAGRPGRVRALDEVEELVLPAPIGAAEAFATSGGTSTLPRTYGGRLSEMDYKTVRYRGHCVKVRLLRDLGLWSDEPVTIAGTPVAPRAVFEALLERELPREGPDLVVLRAEARGRHEGRERTWRLTVIDLMDERTGFTAMQRMTGYPAAMVVAGLARGQSRPGAAPLELALPPAPLLDGLAARGIRLDRELTG